MSSHLILMKSYESVIIKAILQMRKQESEAMIFPG